MSPKKTKTLKTNLYKYYVYKEIVNKAITIKKTKLPSFKKVETKYRYHAACVQKTLFQQIISI